MVVSFNALFAEEFPEFTAKMHELKMSNSHFSRRFEEYHQINRQVHRSETNVEPVSDEEGIPMEIVYCGDF